VFVAQPGWAEQREEGESDMADLLFVVVAIASFAALIAFAYACDRL
jgi:hypothetical protein